MARKRKPTYPSGGQNPGKYVAFDGFNSSRVVASGRNLSKVIEKANKSGVPEPVFFFVPRKGLACLY
jgi:hypothetical protein